MIDDRKCGNGSRMSFDAKTKFEFIISLCEIKVNTFLRKTCISSGLIVTVQTAPLSPRQIHQPSDDWCTVHEAYDALEDIEASPFYGLYKTDDLTIHLPPRCCTEPSGHLLSALTDPEVLFGHIVAIVYPEVVQEQEMVGFILDQTVEESLFFLLRDLSLCVPVLSLPHSDDPIIP